MTKRIIFITLVFGAKMINWRPLSFGFKYSTIILLKLRWLGPENCHGDLPRRWWRKWMILHFFQLMLLLLLLFCRIVLSTTFRLQDVGTRTNDSVAVLLLRSVRILHTCNWKLKAHQRFKMGIAKMSRMLLAGILIIRCFAQFPYGPKLRTFRERSNLSRKIYLRAKRNCLLFARFITQCKNFSCQILFNLPQKYPKNAFRS